MVRTLLRIDLVMGADIQKHDGILGSSINYPDVSRDGKGPPTRLIALERVVVEDGVIGIIKKKRKTSVKFFSKRGNACDTFDKVFTER